jgi:hypothetical protein
MIHSILTPCRTGAVLVFCLILSLTGLGYSQDIQNTDYSWLNGKWSGRPPLGGDLQMTLKVEGQKISGTGMIPTAQGRAVTDVSGGIDRNNITISTYFPPPYGGQVTVIYHCRALEGALNCTTGKGFKTVFRKLSDRQ